MTKNEIIETRNALQNAITAKHSGKMEGMQSLSTSVLLNAQCAKNAKIEGSICAHCYAQKLMKTRKTLGGKMERNTALLIKEVLPLECLPQINSLYFRFEAFGDLNNAIQVVNFFNICKVNPLVSFALWTKNPHFIAQAMKEYGIEKPDNLNIIYSSLFVNVCSAGIKNKYSFIDKVFTVYDADTIQRENVEINCGARHCATCLLCYTKNNTVIINEKLK